MGTTTPSEDRIAALSAHIDEQIARSQALADQSAALDDEITRTTVTTTSPDRRVTVSAQPSGAIVEVVLAPTSVELAPADLARVITTTIARAQRAAADRALELMGDTLGESSELVATIRAEVDAAFPGGREG